MSAYVGIKHYRDLETNKIQRQADSILDHAPGARFDVSYLLNGAEIAEHVLEMISDSADAHCPVKRVYFVMESADSTAMHDQVFGSREKRNQSLLNNLQKISERINANCTYEGGAAYFRFRRINKTSKRAIVVMLY